MHFKATLWANLTRWLAEATSPLRASSIACPNKTLIRSAAISRCLPLSLGRAILFIAAGEDNISRMQTKTRHRTVQVELRGVEDVDNTEVSSRIAGRGLRGGDPRRYSLDRVKSIFGQ